jgi:hypothetical protein
LPKKASLGFDGATNKLMKIVQDLRVRVLFWLVIVLIAQAMEQRARMRRLRTRMYDGGGRRRGRRRR